LRLNHISDNILERAASEVLVVRPAYFYENWAYALKTMQADPPQLESPIPLAEYEIPMVHFVFPVINSNEPTSGHLLTLDR
jgi:hypothetical protein